MIWAEADKLEFFINTVTEPVLAKEKQVKMKKRQSYDNRPYGNTNAVIDKTYINKSSLQLEVIGSLDDLQNASLQDVKDFTIVGMFLIT
jgi:zinc protease